MQNSGDENISLMETALSVISDGAELLGVPTNTLSQAIRSRHRRKAQEAMDILLEKLRKGDISDFVAAHEDEVIDVIYRYGVAARDGAARRNLRLLAQMIVGLVQRDRLYSDEFNKYAEMLARLSRDEIFVIGTLHRFRVKEQKRQGPDVSTHQFWPSFIDALVPAHFSSEEHVVAVCCSALKSGLIITPRDFDSTGEFTTSPLMDEVSELADFEEVL